MFFLPTGNWKPKQCPLIEMVRAAVVFLEMGLYEADAQIFGVHVILDMEGLSMEHLREIDLRIFRQMIKWIQVWR